MQPKRIASSFSTTKLISFAYTSHRESDFFWLASKYSQTPVYQTQSYMSAVADPSVEHKHNFHQLLLLAWAGNGSHYRAYQQHTFPIIMGQSITGCKMAEPHGRWYWFTPSEDLTGGCVCFLHTFLITLIFLVSILFLFFSIILYSWGNMLWNNSWARLKQ